MGIKSAEWVSWPKGLVFRSEGCPHDINRALYSAWQWGLEVPLGGSLLPPSQNSEETVPDIAPSDLYEMWDAEWKGVWSEREAWANSAVAGGFASNESSTHRVSPLSDLINPGLFFEWENQLRSIVRRADSERQGRPGKIDASLLRACERGLRAIMVVPVEGTVDVTRIGQHGLIVPIDVYTHVERYRRWLDSY